MITSSTRAFVNCVSNKIYYVCIIHLISCAAAETELSTFKTNYAAEAVVAHNYLTDAIFSKDRINNPEKYYQSLVTLAEYRDLKKTSAPQALLFLADYCKQKFIDRRQNITHVRDVPVSAYCLDLLEKSYIAIFRQDISCLNAQFKAHLKTRGFGHDDDITYPIASLATHVFYDSVPMQMLSDGYISRGWDRFFLIMWVNET